MKNSGFYKKLFRYVFFLVAIGFPLKYFLLLYNVLCNEYFYDSMILFLPLFETIGRISSIILVATTIYICMNKKIRKSRKPVYFAGSVFFWYPIILLFSPSSIFSPVFYLPFGIPIQASLGSLTSTNFSDGEPWRYLSYLKPGEYDLYVNEIKEKAVFSWFNKKTNSEFFFFSSKKDNSDYWRLTVELDHLEKRIKKPSLRYVDD